MNKIPFKYLVLAVAACAVGLAAYLFMPRMSILQRNSSTTIIASLQKSREVDRLYTGVYYVPLFDPQYGFTKTDYAKEGIKTYINPLKWIEKGQRLLNDESFIDESKGEGKKVIKGTCRKDYDVAFGYDNLLQLLQNTQLIAQVCSKNASAIPDPQILAVNCKKTETNGNYDSTGQCFGWDSSDSQRKRILLQQLQADGLLEKINKRGKESLKNFITAFCD